MNNSSNRHFLFYNAFQNSTDAIIITDLKGVITNVNKAFTALFGWEQKEVIGKTTKILRSPQTTDDFYSEMWDSIQQKGEWKGEIVNKHKDGHLIPILLSITPVIENGTRIGYMGIDIDIRDRIYMQQKIARSERLSAIGKMASKVAHEIRNPLSSITLNAELLEDEINSSASFDLKEANVLLKSIMSEVDRLANLTNEYLQFSRLPKISSKVHTLNNIFIQLQEFLRNELQDKKIKLLLEISKKNILIKYDYDQIWRVFLNLLKNSIESIKYDGNIHITVEENKADVHILFEDDGHGIDKQYHDRIFEPFFTTKNIGTGLGLAISKQIVEDHGGSIKYLNSKKGATFLVILTKDNKRN